MYWIMKPLDVIVRKADGAYIPKSEGNTDYQEYLRWVSLGNVPEDKPIYTGG